MAHWRDGFQGHVARPLHSPFIVLFEQDEEPTSRMMAASLGKMPTTSVRRLISPLSRSRELVECSLVRVGGREGHVGQDVGLGLSRGSRRAWAAWAAVDRPRRATGPWRRKRRPGREGGADEGADHGPPALAGMGHDVPHEVDTAALPGAVHHLADGGLDAFVGVGDDELDAPALRRSASWPTRAGTGSRTPRLPRARPRRPGPRAEPSPFTPHRNDHRHRDDAPGRFLGPSRRWRRSTDGATPPSIGRVRNCRLHPLVDLLAQPRDLALGNPAHAHGLDQVIDRAGRDPLVLYIYIYIYVGLLDHRGQRPSPPAAAAPGRRGSSCHLRSLGMHAAPPPRHGSPSRLVPVAIAAAPADRRLLLAMRGARSSAPTSSSMRRSAAGKPIISTATRPRRRSSP